MNCPSCHHTIIEKKELDSWLFSMSRMCCPECGTYSATEVEPLTSRRRRTYEIAHDRIRDEDGNPLTPSEVAEIVKTYEERK